MLCYRKGFPVVLPANLGIAIPLKQGQEPQLRALLHAVTKLSSYVLLAIKAIGDSSTREQQVDQVLAAVAVRCNQAGFWLVHIYLHLPAHRKQATDVRFAGGCTCLSTCAERTPSNLSPCPAKGLQRALVIDQVLAAVVERCNQAGFKLVHTCFHLPAQSA